MMQIDVGAAALGSRGRPWAGRIAALAELLAVLAAIVVLLPAFARVAEFGAGRDRRFAEQGFKVQGLPEAVLPAACAEYGASAQTSLRERLCPRPRLTPTAPARPAVRDGLPSLLRQAAARGVQAFRAPALDAEARLQALRIQQHEGLGELRAIADAMAAIEAEGAPYLERFQLAPGGTTGPLPLACAMRWAEAALARPPASGAAGGAATRARADVVLLFAAALDGRAETAGLAEGAGLPAPSEPDPSECGDGFAALGTTAALMSDARQSLANARKNEATLALLQTAGWQWAAAMLLGYGLLVASRRAGSARAQAAGVAAALALWAAAAWLGRVPWPLGGSRSFEPARLEPSLWSRPAGFVQGLCLAAAVLAIWAWLSRGSRPRGGATRARAISSRVGYAGLVLATGLGWLLLLDLSANGHQSNRYLSLYHQGHLWLGMLAFSVLVFLRAPLSRGLGWTLAVAGVARRSVAHRLGRPGAVTLLVLATLAAVGLFGVALSNMRQLTSELGRVWLIVGAAWFFFMRAGPLAERLARSGTAGLSLWRHVWPMLYVVSVLVAAMVVTRDMGPLLIAGYGSGAFLAATTAQWWHQRSGRRVSALLLAVGLFAAWVAATTFALFQLGSVDSVTAARLDNLATPFASNNDQLALVTWFQRAAPPAGFGLGNVPWCGYAAAGRCSGVPAQIHSDYTFTAIVGVFGAGAAWVASLGCAVWLHRLIRHHGRVTQGEPRWVAHAGQIASDSQGLLSWLALAWVVLCLCQLAVTVAGNLAVLPLTGVTFPFVSFGLTSLLVNLAFLALCLTLELPPRGRDV